MFVKIIYLLLLIKLVVFCTGTDDHGTHQDDSDKDPTKPDRQRPESLLSGDPNQPRGGREMPQSLFSSQGLPQFSHDQQSIPASPSIKWHEIDTFLGQNRPAAETPPATPQSRQRNIDDDIINEESQVHAERQLAPSLLQQEHLAPSLLPQQRQLAPSLLQQRQLAPSLLQQRQLAPSLLPQQRQLAPSLLQQRQLAPSLLQQRQLAPSLLQQEQIGGHEETTLSIENLLEVLEPDHDISPSIINAYLHMITNGAPEFGVISLDVIGHFQQNEDELKPEWLEEISHEMLVDTALIWFIPAFLTNRQVVLSALDVQKNTLILYDSENPGILSDEKHLLIKMLLRFLSKLYQNNKILETAWLDRILVPRHEKRQDSGIFIMEIAEEIIAQRSVHAHLQLEKELVLVYRKEIFGKLKSIFLMKGKPASQKLLPSIQKQLMIGTISSEKIKSIKKKEADYSKIAFKDILAICKSAAGEDLSAPVIDAYLHMITNGAPEFGVIPLEVIGHFQQNEGELKPEWLERISHEMLDTVLLWFIPGILTTNNQQQHFALTALDVQKNTIFSFDPKSSGIYSESKELLKATILRFLKKLYQSKNMEFKSETTDWSDRFHLPKIVDIADSGIFLAIFADQILRQRSIHAHLEAKKEDVEYYRQKICLNLQENKFTLRMGSNKRRPQSVVTIPPIHKSLQIGRPSQTDRSIGFKPPKKVPSLVEGLMPPPPGKVPSLMKQTMQPPSARVPSLLEQAMPSSSGKVPSLMEQAMPPPSARVPSLMEQAMLPPSARVSSLMEQAMPSSSGKVPSLMEQAMPPPSARVPSLMEKSSNILKMKRITLKFKKEYSEIIRYRKELTETIVDDYIELIEALLKNSEIHFIPMATNFANYSTAKSFLKTHWGAQMRGERVEHMKYWLKIAPLANGHWMLAVVNVEKKMLTLYDPLMSAAAEERDEKEKFCQELLQILRILYTARGLSLDEIRTENFAFARKILNENDTGVFLMMLAQYLIKMSRGIDFKQLAEDDASLRKYRRKIYADLSAQVLFELDDLVRELNVQEVENYLDKITRQHLDSAFVPLDVLTTTDDMENNAWLKSLFQAKIRGTNLWYIPAIVNQSNWVLAVLNRKMEQTVLTIYDPINPGTETREKGELREKILNLILKIYNLGKLVTKKEDIHWREEDRMGRMTNYNAAGNTGVCIMAIAKMIGDGIVGFEGGEQEMVENRLKIFAEISIKFNLTERKHLSASLKSSKKELATSLLTGQKEMQSGRAQKGLPKSLLFEEGMELKYAKSLIEPQKGLAKSLVEPTEESSGLKVDFDMQPGEESYGIFGHQHHADYKEIPSTPSIKWEEINTYLEDTAESKLKASKGKEKQSLILDLNSPTTEEHASGMEPEYATSLLEPKGGMAKSLLESKGGIEPEYATSLLDPKRGMAKSLLESKGGMEPEYTTSLLEPKRRKAKSIVETDTGMQPEYAKSLLQGQTGLAKSLIKSKDIAESKYAESILQSGKSKGKQKMIKVINVDSDDDELVEIAEIPETAGRRRVVTTEEHQTELLSNDIVELLDCEKEVRGNVIDAYLELLTGSREDYGYIPAYVVFYFDHEDVFAPIWFDKWTPAMMDKVTHWFMPARLNTNHWVLAVLELGINTIYFYDSLNALIPVVAKENFKNLMVKFLNDLHAKMRLRRREIKTDNFWWLDIKNIKGVPLPQQENSIDCGVFLMMYARDIVEQDNLFPRMQVRQEKIKECRQLVFDELFNNFSSSQSGSQTNLPTTSKTIEKTTTTVGTESAPQKEQMLGKEDLHIKNDDDDIISEEGGNKKRTKEYYLDHYNQRWDFVTKCENQEEQLEFCAKNWLVRKEFKPNYVRYRCQIPGCQYEALYFKVDGRIYKIDEHNHKLTVDTVEEETSTSASDGGKNRESRSAKKYAYLLNETDELDEKIIYEYLQVIANQKPELNIVPKAAKLETELRNTPRLAWVQRLSYGQILKTKYFLKPVLLHSGNWIFLLLNRKENMLTIYDPINPGEKTDEKTQLETLFFNFMKNVYIVKDLKFDVDKVKVHNPAYVQKLKNRNNASVYLLMLIKNIAKNKEDKLWIDEADIMKYRKEIYDDFSKKYHLELTETEKKVHKGGRKRKGQEEYATSLLDPKRGMAKSLVESKGGEYAPSLLDPKRGMAKSLVESKGGEYAPSLLEPKRGMAKSLVAMDGQSWEESYGIFGHQHHADYEELPSTPSINWEEINKHLADTAESKLKSSKGKEKQSLILDLNSPTTGEHASGMELEYATSLLDPKRGKAKSLVESKGGMEPEYATSLLDPERGKPKSSKMERQSINLNLPYIAHEKHELETTQKPIGGFKRSSISQDPYGGKRRSSAVDHDEDITSSTQQRLSKLQISSTISGRAKSIHAGIEEDTEMGKRSKSSGDEFVAQGRRRSASASSIAHSLLSSIPSTGAMSQGHHPPPRSLLEQKTHHLEQQHQHPSPPSSLLEKHHPTHSFVEQHRSPPPSLLEQQHPSSILEQHHHPSSLLETGDSAAHQIDRAALERSRKKKSKEKTKSLLDTDKDRN